MDGAVVVLMGLFLFAAYFLPAMVAGWRGARLTPAVCVINLFVGWTLIGWVVALAMAVQSEYDPENSLRSLLTD